MVREAIRLRLQDAVLAESEGMPANGLKQNGTQTDLHFQALGEVGAVARRPEGGTILGGGN